MSVSRSKMDFFFTPMSLFSDEYALLTAIQNRCYPTIYAHLRRMQGQFEPETAFWLCYFALDCTPRVFSILLEHCPPPEDFCHCCYPLSHIFDVPHGLAEAAAYYDKSKHLKLLLDRGLSPNALAPGALSPMEAALEGSSLLCVELLLSDPRLDCSLTPRILARWARGGMENSILLDFCLTAMAPRFLGQTPSLFDPAPMPPARDLIFHAISAMNYPLCRRLIPDAQLTPDQTCAAMELLSRQKIDVEKDYIPLFSQLIRACPTVLNRRLPRFLTVCCALLPEDGIPEEIKPLLDRMSGRGVVLVRNRLRSLPPKEFLHRWEQRLGERFFPVLRSDSCLPDPAASPHDLLLYARSCRVWGPKAAGQLSALAWSLLFLATPPILIHLFYEGDLFSHEDPGTLADLSRYSNLPEENRAVAATFARSKTHYEL